MPTPLIIDADPGVDDAVALMLALHSPEVEVRAVTATYGNVDLTTTFDNARRVLALAGRGDVPVAAGASRPLVHARTDPATHVHGADGLGGHRGALPEPHGPPAGAGSALGLTETVLRSADRPVTIVAIGPLTDVALLLATQPALASRIERIVVMGGSLGGSAPVGPEFNVYCDPEAAHRVLTQAEVPVTLVPLDVTQRCLADGGWLSALRASGPRCAVLERMLAPYRIAHRRHHGVDAVALHDTVATLEAVLPGTLRTTPMPISVACDFGPARGMLVPDRSPGASGPPVDVALDADLGRVLAETLDRLRRLDVVA